VKIFRTLPTKHLILILVGAVIVAVAGASIAVAAGGGGGGNTPPAVALPNAIHDALTAKKPSGVTARIKFTNNLFPSGSLLGQTTSALMSGAGGRLWANPTGGRLELQSDAGDVQITWNDTKVTIYDASSNTAYTFNLPQQQSTTTTPGQPPSLDQITTFLNDLGKDWNISGAQPDNIAGQQAYTVTISPSHDGGLLGSAQLAWDAMNGVPLKVEIYAQGSSTPALALDVTDISFGDVADSDVQVSPPAGAKIVDLSSQASGQTGSTSSAPAVTGLAAVQAAASFPVTAPDSLVGLTRRDVRLVGPTDSRSAIAVYGQGLGAIIVVERANDSSSGAPAQLQALPTVSLDHGTVTAHELSTQLGTVLTWNKGGVSYILAGSVPSSAAEAAAAALNQ